MHAEEVEDRQMLSGLGHDAFVSGHDQQSQVDAADAGQHVLDEALMAGHVDDADFAAAGQLEPGEAEVDGHAPVLLLLEAVGVDAGERPHQGRFAVVDVAGGTDDEHTQDCSLG